MLAERGLTLRLTDRARDFLAEAGYDPTYGARPLKRAIRGTCRIRWRWRYWRASSSAGIRSQRTWMPNTAGSRSPGRSRPKLSSK